MNLSEAVEAVRALHDLPEPRRAYLVAKLLEAETTGAWRRIVGEAQQEALRAALSTQEAFRKACADRAAVSPQGAPQKPPKPRRRLTDAEREEVRRLKAAGVPVAEISERYGVATSWVYKITAAPEPRPVIVTRERTPEEPPPPVLSKARKVARHGTNSKYTSGCRCDECRAAATAYARERRERKRQETSSDD